LNLRLVHALLEAAEEQPYGFLKVCEPELAREVELMASAGLVHASPAQDGGGAVTINRVTESGRAFLRAFKNQPLPAKELASAEST
jgi:hypothetical protein